MHVLSRKAKWAKLRVTQYKERALDYQDHCHKPSHPILGQLLFFDSENLKSMILSHFAFREVLV